MTGVGCFVLILAALAGGVLGCLLTIGHYHRVGQVRAAYEAELAQSQDALVAMALLRRVRADRHQGSCSREG
jgi:hypothetical protein